ncbi:hypothetical protein LCGC14_1852550, partial [marine sediment metagenome]
IKFLKEGENKYKIHIDMENVEIVVPA